MTFSVWRPCSESNRGWRGCNPLPSHLATGPKNWDPIISILFPHRSGQHGGVDNWCSREDSNLHGRYVPLGSQPSVSAYSTTRANMVPKVGLEPTPPEGDRFLRPARLPVPPLRRDLVEHLGIEPRRRSRTMGLQPIPSPYRSNAP